MRFEEALAELRKGKKIQMSSRDWIIFSLEDEHGYCLGVNDFVNEDWQTLEEPGKTFPEVFEAFKEGKKIKRKSWTNERYFLHKECEEYCECVMGKIDRDDLMEKDWEILD